MTARGKWIGKPSIDPENLGEKGGGAQRKKRKKKGTEPGIPPESSRGLPFFVPARGCYAPPLINPCPVSISQNRVCLRKPGRLLLLQATVWAAKGAFSSSLLFWPERKEEKKYSSEIIFLYLCATFSCLEDFRFCIGVPEKNEINPFC